VLEPGASVRLKADPGRVGIITGKKRERAGKVLWQVRFPDGTSYYREVHIEVLSEVQEDPIELLRQGKLGRARDLRGIQRKSSGLGCRWMSIAGNQN
jgi:hypothetical protein